MATTVWNLLWRRETVVPRGEQVSWRLLATYKWEKKDKEQGLKIELLNCFTLGGINYYWIRIDVDKQGKGIMKRL